MPWLGLRHGPAVGFAGPELTTEEANPHDGGPSLMGVVGSTEMKQSDR